MATREQLNQIKEALAAIHQLPDDQRQKLIHGITALKSLTVEDLTELKAEPAFASCGPCDPCSPSGEIGIESGW